MLYTVTHKTSYKYHDTVSICHNLAWLIPRNTARQQCIGYDVVINPRPSVLHEYEDYFGNKVLYFAVQEEHESLDVKIVSKIKLIPQPQAGNELYAMLPWEQVLQDVHQGGGDELDALQFIPATDATATSPSVEAFARQSFTPGRPMLDALTDLNSRIFHEFKFHPGFTTVSTPIEVVMKERKGVCQDFAHLAVACLRSLGLPARYMSGYIETLPPPGKPKLTGVDASHAWFAAYIPNVGWLEFDPTNNQIPGSQHLTIGWGRDYADIPPMKGVILSSGAHELKVSVDVKRGE